METNNEDISRTNPKIESEGLVSEEKIKSEKKKRKRKRENSEFINDLLADNPNQECELKTEKSKIEYNSAGIHIPDSTTVVKLETEIKVKKKKRDREEIEIQSDIKIKKLKTETETEFKQKKKKNKHKHLEHEV